MDKLFLIDGMGLVFRAYHAMLASNLQSPSGEPTSAVFGFINQLQTLLKEADPKNIVVAFDSHEPTFRHKIYKEYKANRDTFPEQLVPQLKRIKEFLDIVGIYRIQIPGYEADDIIGSIAKQYKDYFIYCVTSDKDYYQLVDERIHLLKPSKVHGINFDLVDLKAVEEKFGGTPDQVRDVLALIGDTADNIPGVKGIGEKTAIPLVQEYGSIEKIYENIDKIKSASTRKKLAEGAESAKVALELVTIVTDMELPEIRTKVAPINSTELAKFMSDLNFTQLRRKWFSLSESEETEPEIPTFEKFSSEKSKYQFIGTAERLREVVRELSSAPLLAVDTETSSLNKMTCSLVGISLSVAAHTGYYISVDDRLSTVSAGDNLFSDLSAAAGTENHSDRIPLADAVNILKPLLENPKIGKCGQNLKFDAIILRRKGINLAPIVFDSMIAAHILNPDSALNLDSLAKEYLNYEPIPIENLIGIKKATQKSMAEIAPAEISDYACEDADVAFRLQEKLKPILAGNNQTKLAEEIEFPLVSVLTAMESTGIKIDVAGLKDISVAITEQLAGLRSDIYKESGIEFNLDSPKQLSEILFDVMMIPPVKKTKTGYSTDVETLTLLSYANPIAEYLLKYRQLSKLKNTYIDTLPNMLNPATGRLHTNYNQAGTNTGRLSSSDPNLQNIPIKSDLGKEVRKAFIPGYPNYSILSADYSQVELRIMAYVSQDENLIAAFKNGLDVHSSTASILNNIPIEEVTPDLRRIAKTVNFGIMYGLGAFGLAQRLGMPRRQAGEIIENYFEKYPGIKAYMDKTIAETERLGYTETICGRRRYFPDINSSNKNIRTAQQRAAINMPIQGTGSDMIKRAMLGVYNALQREKLRANLLLQVHDELVFECHDDDITALTALVKSEMESALLLGDVPVISEVGFGKNWLEAH
ncbi:MAG: DNA polymerase I [Candidatus Kapabacteria bacterium]|nr:DNA polymerase I [Candidatus Kapabacteria bacterium]